MKFLFCTISLLILSSFLFAQSKAQEDNESDIIQSLLQLEEHEFDFGDIMEGETFEHTFKFVNKGKEPLVISNILTSCGCTVINWSRTPVYPGKKGEFTARFDTKNKFGKQAKSLIILSNSTTEKIYLFSNVIPRKEAQISH